jgi:general stress protein 26
MHFESQTVEQILLVAKETTAKVPYCWVATADQRGGVNARVVQPFFSQLDHDGWAVRFLTSRSSRKAREIAGSGRIALGYQYDPELACVTLIGAARLTDDRDLVQDQWRPEWNTFFPKGPSDLDAVIVEVMVERIEIWSLLRKIATPPNGLRATTLQRAASGGWQPLHE